MSSSIKHFLLVFDHSEDRLIHQEEFGGRVEAATARYAELEDEHKDSASIDIVLVGSDSMESVKATHRTYFAGFRNASLDEAELERLFEELL